MAYVVDVCMSLSQKPADVHLLDRSIEMGPVLTCETTQASLTPVPIGCGATPPLTATNSCIRGIETLGRTIRTGPLPSFLRERVQIPLTAMASFKLSSLLRQAQ